jgi:orotate phosphoribosyltransferase
MKESEVLRTLEDLGVMLHGHFVLSSGLHSGEYINKNKLFPHTRETSELCHAIANHLCWGDSAVAVGGDIDVVVGPATGGIILSHCTAHHLTQITRRNVLSVYAEKTKDGKSFFIGRDQDSLIAGKRILVVEDVLTTGSSVKKVIEVVRTLGGNVVCLAAICNRGSVTAKDVGEVPELYSLANINIATYSEKECPFCADGVPVDPNIGRGKEFLAKKKAF